MSIENKKVITRQLTEYLDQGNEEKLSALLAADFVSHFAGFAQPINRQQYIQINRMAQAAFSDLKSTVVDLVAG